jgi:hypothetical protein
MDGPMPTDGKSRQYSLRGQPIKKVRIKLPERGEALHPLQERFVFWTPAVQYLYGGLNDTILTDFQESINQEVIFYHHRFQLPLFRGLETPRSSDWNYVLWAVERELWDPLVDHFCSATMVDRPWGIVCKYALQDLEVADPLYMQRAIIPNEVAILPVHAFGVKTNKWIAAFDVEAAHPVLDPPKLRFYDADEECKMYARAVFSGSDPEAAHHETTKEQARGSANGLSPGDGS